MNLKKQKSKDYDQARHALQAPVGGPRYRVIYRHQTDRLERMSPWFSNQSRAAEACQQMARKYGQNNVIIYMD